MFVHFVPVAMASDSPLRRSCGCQLLRKRDATGTGARRCELAAWTLPWYNWNDDSEILWPWHLDMKWRYWSIIFDNLCLFEKCQAKNHHEEFLQDCSIINVHTLWTCHQHHLLLQHRDNRNKETRNCRTTVTTKNTRDVESQRTNDTR